MKKLVPLLVALVVSVLAPGCGTVTPYAAVVDGTRITRDALDGELKAIRSNEEYLQSLEEAQAGRGLAVRGQGNDTFDAAFVAQVLTRRIFLELVHQEVERQKLTISDEELDRARSELRESFGGGELLEDFPTDYVEEIVLSTAEVNVLREALANQHVSAEDVERYYQENQAQFSETCVSHILVATAAEADAVRARLAAGEDFAAVAGETSNDPGSARDGGSLGCLTATDAAGFVAPFRDAMQALPVGEVSEPVETQFGFHVIKVTSRDPQPLSEVRDAVRQELSGGQAGAAFDEFLLDAVADADITVNPRYGRWVTGDADTGQTPHVEPPRKPTTTTVAEGPAEFPMDPGTGAPPPSGQ